MVNDDTRYKARCNVVGDTINMRGYRAVDVNFGKMTRQHRIKDQKVSARIKPREFILESQEAA